MASGGCRRCVCVNRGWCIKGWGCCARARDGDSDPRIGTRGQVVRINVFPHALALAVLVLLLLVWWLLGGVIKSLLYRCTHHGKSVVELERKVVAPFTASTWPPPAPCPLHRTAPSRHPRRTGGIRSAVCHGST